MRQTVQLVFPIIALVAAVTPETCPADVLRVDIASNATSPDGSDWNGSTSGNCYKFLQDALSAASDGDEIRVAQGTHRPDEDTTNPTGSGDQTESFVMKFGVVVTGGYKGVIGYADETANDRDPGAYVTVLSGDLDDDDVGDLDDPSRSENSYTVVNGGVLTTALTELDGVTVRDGHGDTAGLGAGVFVPEGSNPTFRNCVPRLHA